MGSAGMRIAKRPDGSLPWPVEDTAAPPAAPDEIPDEEWNRAAQAAFDDGGELVSLYSYMSVDVFWCNRDV